MRHVNLDAIAKDNTIVNVARHSYVTGKLPGMALPTMMPKPRAAPVKTEPLTGPRKELPQGIDAASLPGRTYKDDG